MFDKTILSLNSNQDHGHCHTVTLKMAKKEIALKETIKEAKNQWRRIGSTHVLQYVLKGKIGKLSLWRDEILKIQHWTLTA